MDLFRISKFGVRVGVLRACFVSILVFAVTCNVCRAQIRTSDERALWLLWKRHINNPGKHEELAAACDKLVKQAPHDPLAAVTRGIAAWHLLKAGRTDTAAALMEAMISDAGPGSSLNVPGRSATTDCLREAALRMARAWLTRIDREQVKRALQKLYVREIEYPESLDAVAPPAGEMRPPSTDRWGKPWSYRLVTFRRLKGLRGQKYELQSAALGKHSDLRQSLEIPYGSRIRLKPVKILSSAPGKETVQFVTTDESGKHVILSLGTESDGIFFAHSGSNILILSDGSHWMVLPKPK